MPEYNDSQNVPLSSAFYCRDARSVARDLLGTILVSKLGEEVVGGYICETEAYVHEGDDANHGIKHGKTERNQSMFEEPGTVYVYLIYGIHHCLNISVLDQDIAEAVLIRSLVPEWGIDLMQYRRQQNRQTPVSKKDLMKGPGNLCTAMSITRDQDGGVIYEKQGLTIYTGQSVEEHQITRTSRVGIDYAERASEWPLRFIWDGGHFSKAEDHSSD